MGEKETQQAVNDYIKQGIDALSIDRLKKQYCTRILMTFKNGKIESKVKFLTHLNQKKKKLKLFLFSIQK